MNSGLKKAKGFPGVSLLLEISYLIAETHLQCQCGRANSMQIISSGAKQFDSFPYLLFCDIPPTLGNVLTLNWMIPKTIFLGSMPSQLLINYLLPCFVTRKQYVAHLHCHLLCLILYLTSKNNFSLPSINILLVLLGKWLLQLIEHLLCLEPIIPTIYHWQTSLPS